MATSFDTVREVFKIMRRHCTDEQIEKIIDDLLVIDGNKSFRDTIRWLAGEDAARVK